MQDATLTIIGDNGQEILCDILFTYYSEEFGKHYVVFTPRGTDECSAAEYIESGAGAGELKHIESDEEWALLEDLLEDYCNNMEEGCAGCQGDCDGECDCEGECHCHE